jgi:hypothetical protein
MGVVAAVALQVVVYNPSEGAAQVPQPFPRPQTPAPARPTPPASPAVTAPAAPAAKTTAADPSTDPNAAPTEASLGFPLYPNSQFITSYDAGKGQRYYLFGSAASFTELVKYYQSVLKTKGTLVFEQPPTQMFEVGRFREDLMAFPPGVTIKDYTWGGSAGYLSPKRDGKPERFPSIIQVVPALPGAPR